MLVFGYRLVAVAVTPPLKLDLSLLKNVELNYQNLKGKRSTESKVCLSFVLFPFLGKFKKSVVSVLRAQVSNAQIPALTRVISNDNVDDDGEK